MNEPKALQLLLKRGWEDPEGHGGPLLAPPCGEKGRDDQAPLEGRQQIPKYEALARRLEVEPGPFREVTRHGGRIRDTARGHNGTAVDFAMILDLKAAGALRHGLCCGMRG